MQLTTTTINTGMTFSDGIISFRENHNKNLFEKIITINTIEEDENLSTTEKENLINILNSNINPFEKRLRIMRSLDKEKDFSSKIAMVLRKKPTKMEMVKEILIIFRDEYTKKDILKKDFGEVLTPLSTVKEMVSEIEEEFWNTPYDKDGNIKRILETSNGSGIFLWCVVYKFMYGLKNHFPNEDERYKFIIEKMIFACELQKSKMFNWLCTADLYDEHDLNVYCGSYLDNDFNNHMKEVWGIEKFSLTISNPPYQEMDGGNAASAKPIYNLFTEKSIEISDRVLFITPSRWFAGGKGLDKFRKMMMKSNKIVLIKHFDDASKIFGKLVEIKGGVSYFLYDNNYNGYTNFNNTDISLEKYDIIVKDINSYSILSKLNKFDNISKLCKGRGDNSFGIQTNDSRLTSSKLNDDYLKVYISKQKGFIKWIDGNIIKKHSNTHNFKVFTTEAAGSTNDLGRFGNTFIGEPDTVCSGSYIWFPLSTVFECESLKSYLETKFTRYLLSLRKISQHIKPDTLKWIPIVPFDRIWTDELLFEYFNLSKDETNHIIK